MKNIQEILTIWHKHFEDESFHYCEYEASDIEYFVGCMLYNHFDFDNALHTMKTIDLSYDFLLAVESNYDEMKNKIDSINIKNELEKINFLTNFLDECKTKYTQDELYLINRLAYHVDGIMQRVASDEKLDSIEFIAPKARLANPLLR